MSDPSPWAIEAEGLGKQYGRGWALRDCSFRLPAGHICALVGPNGAGKSTFLGTATRLVQPTTGTLKLFGVPVSDPAVLSRVSFLAQDKPLYPRFTVAETLRLGRELNPRWDQELAERIVRSGKVPLSARIGTLSGGQRTRVAFALAFGKRPELLLLDEPMSDLDPLARHEMSGLLMAEAAEHGTTVLMSSHMLSEMEVMCDYLLVLAEGRLRMAGQTDDLIPAHLLVTGVAEGDDGVPEELRRQHTVVESRVTGRQFSALIRSGGPLSDSWEVLSPSMEEVLLAYLRSPDAPTLIADESRVDGPRGAAA
ncbi:MULTISPECIES: ABC transporter ATP-binding protein [Streptomyces]|uniref:ABC transporter ATP-binding protein n=1 Tax=Streptomyces nigrescens TaxID=1920 RepID=A0ABY7J9P2_STRNI|nr:MULTISPECIES: ABC transporter ATP-binding protein [Streptomyces]AWN27714.1 ABC transporter ATP-binding protein [Streptomyces sp. NEAU-S7GS2]MYT11544.1 ATP-binding cassette domain-containing protein [Streptomyces sp. SID4951]WAU06501.1 ABC transporter ATP-binding protein [Streptomyces nigrescens]SCK10738.1 ABC-2 type transport system ATP-binding protein [Streptomyces sp. SceaMP-e96]